MQFQIYSKAYVGKEIISDLQNIYRAISLTCLTFCNSDRVKEFANHPEKLNCISRQCGDYFGTKRRER